MPSTKTIAFVAVFGLLGVGVAAASLKGEPKRRVTTDLSAAKKHVVSPDQLATWIVEGRRDFAIVDLRPASAYAAGHVKDAVNCGSCHESREQGQKAQHGESFVDLSKKVVVYTEKGTERVELPKIIAQNPQLYVLEGGWESWKATVLAPVVMGGETDEEQIAQKRKKEAMRAFFAGERPTAAPAALPVSPIRREGSHKAAAAREGC